MSMTREGGNPVVYRIILGTISAIKEASILCSDSIRIFKRPSFIVINTGGITTAWPRLAPLVDEHGG